jgi:GntR family transcriptional regulator
MPIPAGTLDRDSPVPLYFQIAESLRQAVRDGMLKPGDRLDNELELAQRWGVSRPTVRQAVQQLADQGLVVRRRGLGTVVVAPRIMRPVALTSLYDDLSAAHRRPATKVLATREVLATTEIAAALSLPAGAAVLEIERLRIADGTPLAIMHNYLPAGLLSGNVAAALERTGLYELLRARNVQPHLAEQVIGARPATAPEARLLGADRGATMLTMTRTAYDHAGQPIEHGSHAYLADRYSFKMTVANSRR